MPYINATIPRVWKMASDGPDKIHYIVQSADGRQRRLIAKRGHALFTFLETELLNRDYHGPASASAADLDMRDHLGGK